MIKIPLTPEQFGAKAEELSSQYGIRLEGQSGTISKNGVTAAWAYDGANLSVSITHKPFFVSTTYCEKQLTDWLQS